MIPKKTFPTFIEALSPRARDDRQQIKQRLGNTTATVDDLHQWLQGVGEGCHLRIKTKSNNERVASSCRLRPATNTQAFADQQNDFRRVVKTLCKSHLMDGDPSVLKAATDLLDHCRTHKDGGLKKTPELKHAVSDLKRAIENFQANAADLPVDDPIPFDNASSTSEFDVAIQSLDLEPAKPDARTRYLRLAMQLRSDLADKAKAAPLNFDETSAIELAEAYTKASDTARHKRRDVSFQDFVFDHRPQFALGGLSKADAMRRLITLADTTWLLGRLPEACLERFVDNLVLFKNYPWELDEDLKAERTRWMERARTVREEQGPTVLPVASNAQDSAEILLNAYQNGEAARYDSLLTCFKWRMNLNTFKTRLEALEHVMAHSDLLGRLPVKVAQALIDDFVRDK